MEEIQTLKEDRSTSRRVVVPLPFSLQSTEHSQHTFTYKDTCLLHLPPLASRCFCKYGLFIKVSPAERHGQILSAIFRKLTNSELREVWLLPLECVYSSVCTCVLGSSNALTLTGIHDLYCSVYVSETGL